MDVLQRFPSSLWKLFPTLERDAHGQIQKFLRKFLPKQESCPPPFSNRSFSGIIFILHPEHFIALQY